MAVQIKYEPSDSVSLDPVELEHRLITLTQSFPSGITQSTLRSQLPEIPILSLVPILNSLQKSGRLEVLQTSNGELIWKAKDPALAEKVRVLDSKEQMVYAAIEEKGNLGTWVQDLRRSTRLPNVDVQKILKALESRRLIKTVRPASAQKKKVYMLAELEPDPSLLGGTWLSGEGAFEQEFADVLLQQCTILLQRKATEAQRHTDPMSRRNAAFVSVADVLQFISSSGISKVKLKPTDINRLLECLVAEGTAEFGDFSDNYVEEASIRVDLDTNSPSAAAASSAVLHKQYRISTPAVDSCGLAKVPCGFCKVRRDCKQGHDISPESCLYLTEWLDLQF